MAINEFDHPDHGWKWTACEVRWIETKIAEAVAAEREACAKVCREIAILRLDSGMQPGCCSQVADMCNVAILKRSNAVAQRAPACGRSGAAESSTSKEREC